MLKTRCTVIFTVVILFFFSIPQPSHSQDDDLVKGKKLIQRLIQLYKEGLYTEAIPIAK